MQILIDIDPEGATTVKVEGLKGRGCQDVTREIERALGSVARDDKTPEFYQPAEQGRRLRAGQ